MPSPQINLDNKYSSLLPFLITTLDRDHISQGIKKLHQNLFETRMNLNQRLSLSFSRQIAQTLYWLISTDQIDQEDPQVIERWLKELENYLDTFQIIPLEIAVQLPEDTLKKISQWFYQRYHQNILLSIQINPGILGGAVFYLDGEYFNYSLGHKLNTMAEKGEFKLSRLLADRNT